MTTSIDYQLLTKYKNTGRISYRDQLLLNYIPKLKTEAYKLQQKNKHIDFEDIFQDLSIMFIEHVKWANPDKITNTAQYGIWGSFKYLVMNYRKKEIANSTKVKHDWNFDYDWRVAENHISKVDYDDSITMTVHSKRNYNIDNQYLDQLLTAFTQSLQNTLEKKIWKALAINKSQFSKKDITKKLGLKSQAALTYHINKLERKFESYIEQNGIY